MAFRNEQKAGSVSFSPSGRFFHCVPGKGSVLELDEAGVIIQHADTPEGRIAEVIGRIPAALRDKIWELFQLEHSPIGKFDCHMAAGYIGGQPLSRDIEIPVGQPMSIAEAVEKFGFPSGMQLRLRRESMPLHSMILLCSEGNPATLENTFVYHKPGRMGDGEIVSAEAAIARYRFNEARHEVAFYELSKTA